MSENELVPVEQFKREERYIVIKRKHLHPMTEASLRNEMRDLGISTVECVVVESDWPEYETVWRMIEDRVTGRMSSTPTAEQDEGLVEKVKRAVMITQGCGYMIDGERVFCDDKRVKQSLRRACDCEDAARKLISMLAPSIRAKALEEAAKVADSFADMNAGSSTADIQMVEQSAVSIAAAIRSLKGEQSS